MFLIRYYIYLLQIWFTIFFPKNKKFIGKYRMLNTESPANIYRVHHEV